MCAEGEATALFSVSLNPEVMQAADVRSCTSVLCSPGKKYSMCAFFLGTSGTLIVEVNESKPPERPRALTLSAVYSSHPS